MIIKINTDQASHADLAALIELCRTLMGGAREETPPDAVTERPKWVTEKVRELAADEGDAVTERSKWVAEKVPELEGDEEDAAATDPAARDTAGLPWDARIHSSNHKFTAEGRWRQRRNLSAAVLAEVEAELRGAAVPAPPPPTVPAPPPPVAELSYLQLVRTISAAMANGLSMNTIVSACAKHGSPSGVSGLQGSPDAWAPVLAELGLAP